MAEKEVYLLQISLAIEIERERDGAKLNLEVR